MEQWEVLDLLDSLVNKSLVQAEEADGEVRYGLLETVRQYGQERLAAAGGAERLRDRHLAWYLALAEEAAPHLVGAEQVTWLDRLEAEHDNLRAALRWARERGAAEEGLRLAGALGRFWLTRGYLGRGARLAGGSAGRGRRRIGVARARALHGRATWRTGRATSGWRWPRSSRAWPCIERWATRGVALSLHHLASTRGAAR